MRDELSDIKALWQTAKESSAKPLQKPEGIIAKAQSKKKSSLYQHYGNAGILCIWLIVVCFFFYYLYPFAENLSQAGVHLMVGGMALRIVVEAISLLRFLKIDLSDQTLKVTKDTVEFYDFRRTVNGPVTYMLVGIYIVGFFMLTPECSTYMGTLGILALDFVAIGMGVVLIRIIGKGIRQEMEDLWMLIELRKKLME
jgi:hypothetical protein